MGDSVGIWEGDPDGCAETEGEVEGIYEGCVEVDDGDADGILVGVSDGS